MSCIDWDWAAKSLYQRDNRLVELRKNKMAPEVKLNISDSHFYSSL